MVRRAKIIQPSNVNYLMQTTHYSKFYAQEYLAMLISKAENYIDLKRQGKKVATNKTIEQIEEVLYYLRQCEIIEIEEITT